MSSILVVAGSPATAYYCQLLEDLVVHRLTARGDSIEQLAVRDLSVLALMHHQVDTPALVSALAQVAPPTPWCPWAPGGARAEWLTRLLSGSGA